MDDEFRPETLVAIAGDPGSYTLTIGPASKTTRGRYTVRLDPPRTASAADESRVEAERAFARGRMHRDASKAATWAAALADFEAARDRFRALGDTPGELKALIEIAVTENYMSRSEALASVQAAERIARELDDRPAIARVLRVLASVHALAGDFGAAARSVEEATV